MLVIANEDYEGVNPDYPDDVTAPKYARMYVDALEDSGYLAGSLGHLAARCAAPARRPRPL